ncbi:dynamin family protein [Pseudonocardia petroleophila]|uniref:Dynamin family protein n=1 Tax=Pseudonocardia petroleophila TaxID=37331 RepID=A0A7G7MEE6_9PSEU|nr:dynamin family protein [Pseudonocardia petroleophila]QNG51157.1 dynamin family protein [Pseudonocardia petroleophila]
MSTVVAGVLRLANEVHGLAKAAGREDLRAPLAEQAARWKDGTTTVVLAGAQKRGKSRLLNCLVGHPDLLPVDADIATHTQVAVTRGPELTVTVLRTDGSRTVVDPAELPAYASVLGDPAVLREVTGLEVTIDEPLLDGLRLVDTPGVDSLTLGHRHATMGALARADALLFAVSAQDQPILRHELEFLAEAADRILSVAFVLTKVEDSTSWRDLLAENRARLARFCGPDGPGVDPEVARRLLEAPWLPVSAKLGEAALTLQAAGHTERAAARLERSGLPGLRRHVERCGERRELVRAGGVLGLVVSGIRALSEPEEDRAAGDADDELAQRQAVVDEEIAALTALKRERRRRSIDHQLIGRRVVNRARARLEAYRRTYERELVELTKPADVSRYAATLPESIERTLGAAWQEISADTERTVAEALPRYLAEMGVDPSELDRVVMEAPVRAPGELNAEGPGGKFDVIGEGVPALMMASSVGFLSSHAFVGLAFGLSFLAPVAIGGLLAGTLLAHRRRLAEATRNRTALTKALGDAFLVATNEMSVAVEQAVAAWRGGAEQAVDAAFAVRQQELDARRRELAGLAAQDAAARKRAAAAAQSRLDTLTEADRRARELSAELAKELAVS